MTTPRERDEGAAVDPAPEPAPEPAVDPAPDLASSPAPRTPPVLYKGEPLEAARGPGLGCFRFQVVLLGIFIVLTPLTVAWNWPFEVSAALLFATLILLLVAGQTIIFLLRLVAADRRAEGRRRPLASATRTVGELEDEDDRGAEPAPASGEPTEPLDQGRSGDPGVRE